MALLILRIKIIITNPMKTISQQIGLIRMEYNKI